MQPRTGLMLGKSECTDGGKEDERGQTTRHGVNERVC